MDLTYHPDAMTTATTHLVPYSILHPDIQEFLVKCNSVQVEYSTRTNGLFFFIHLDNGDRVDCKLPLN